MGMVMEDLGQPIRDAMEEDGAMAAVTLHAVRPSEILGVTLDAAWIRLLPSRSSTHLAYLQQVGRWTEGSDLAEMLIASDKAAPTRAEGAELPPFGESYIASIALRTSRFTPRIRGAPGRP
jgi:hypothetical protein